MIERFWRLATPIISAILGIWAVGKFNFFEQISFVPKENAYEICITVYFALFDIILKELGDCGWVWIKEKFCSEIDIVICQIGAEANIKANPTITFNNQDQAEADILVSVKGHKKHFKSTEIIIKHPAFADIQGAYRRKEVRVDNDNYYINLESLFGGSDLTSFNQTFRIVLAQMPVDGTSISELKPEIQKKRCNIMFRHNVAQVKARRR